MLTLKGEVYGRPLSDFNGLPVYYNHNYQTGPLGGVTNGNIILFHPEQNLVDAIKNNKIYLVYGGIMENGKEKIMEVTLTAVPLEPDKATKATIIEGEL